MWCPNCNRISPIVAIQGTELVCAQCHVEVLPLKANIHNSKNDVVANKEMPQRHLSTQSGGEPVLGRNATDAKDCDTKLFRFDAPHSQNTPKSQDQENSSLPAFESRGQDSPHLVGQITIFFLGQALIIWAYFFENVNALGLGMITSIAAVGLALQTTISQGKPATPSSFDSIRKGTSEVSDNFNLPSVHRSPRSQTSRQQ